MRSILVAASRVDPVGLAASEILRKEYGLEEYSDYRYIGRIYGSDLELRLIDVDSIYADMLGTVSHDLIVFISRHEAHIPRPMLLVHPTGNLSSEALFGGRPRCLSIAAAEAMASALRTLKYETSKRGLSYIVSYEATHHGPTIAKPILFIEVGSTPREWGDICALESIVEAVISTTRSKSGEPTAIGVGGSHYNHKFTSLCLDERYVFGHIIPGHIAWAIDREIFSRCIDMTLENVEYAIFDWDNLKSSDRSKLIEYAKDAGLEIVKV
ncbi:MAG: D-aminoacyl-tRNA deacylase [Candidatus Bathyarchaeia archaeon]